MRKWEKVKKFKSRWIVCGSILRINFIEKKTERYCRRASVDYLIFKLEKNGRHGLVRMTGQKAGLIYVVLPEDSGNRDNTALSLDWLICNWGEWVDSKSDALEANIGYWQTEKSRTQDLPNSESPIQAKESPATNEMNFNEISKS